MKPTEKQIDDLKNNILIKGLCEAFNVPFEKLFVIQDSDIDEPTALATEPKDDYSKTYPLNGAEFDDLIVKIKDFYDKSQNYISEGILLNGFWSDIFSLILDMIGYLYNDDIRSAFALVDWNGSIEGIKQTLLSYYE